METKKSTKKVLSYTQPTRVPTDKKHFFIEMGHFQEFQTEQFIKFEEYVKKMIYNNLIINFKNENQECSKKYMHIPRFDECFFENEIKKNIIIFLKRYIKSKDNLNYYAKYLNDQIINEYKMIYNFIRSKTIHMIINQEIELVHDFKKIFKIKLERKINSMGFYNLKLLIINKKFIIEFLREVNPLCDVLNTRLRNETSTSLIEYNLKRFFNILIPNKWIQILNKVKSIDYTIIRYEDLKKHSLRFVDNIIFTIRSIIRKKGKDMEKDIKSQYLKFIKSIFLNLGEIKIDSKLSQKTRFTSVNDKLLIITKICYDFDKKVKSLNIKYKKLFLNYLRRLLYNYFKIKSNPDDLFNDFKTICETTKYLYDLEIKQTICDFSLTFEENITAFYNILVEIYRVPEIKQNEFMPNFHVLTGRIEKDLKSIHFWLYQIFYFYIDNEIIIDVNISNFNLPKTSEEKIKLFDKIDKFIDNFYFEEVSENLTAFSNKYQTRHLRLQIIYYLFSDHINLRLDHIKKKKQEFENFCQNEKGKNMLDVKNKIFELFSALENEYNKYLEFFLRSPESMD